MVRLETVELARASEEDAGMLAGISRRASDSDILFPLSSVFICRAIVAASGSSIIFTDSPFHHYILGKFPIGMLLGEEEESF